jgi:hypothetical protein
MPYMAEKKLDLMDAPTTGIYYENLKKKAEAKGIDIADIDTSLTYGENLEALGLGEKSLEEEGTYYARLEKEAKKEAKTELKAEVEEEKAEHPTLPEKTIEQIAKDHVEEVKPKTPLRERLFALGKGVYGAYKTYKKEKISGEQAKARLETAKAKQMIAKAAVVGAQARIAKYRRPVGGPAQIPTQRAPSILTQMPSRGAFAVQRASTGASPFSYGPKFNPFNHTKRINPFVMRKPKRGMGL